MSVPTKADETAAPETAPAPLWRFYAYFLRLGAAGFGGPIALAGFMQRDLVEERRWITRQDYLDGLALAQLAPGPLAAQLAMYLGYVRAGVVGATVVSAGLHPAVVPDGLGDLGCLRPLRRAAVDGSVVLRRRRGGHRHHRPLDAQAHAIDPGSPNAALDDCRGHGAHDGVDGARDRLAVSPRRCVHGGGGGMARAPADPHAAIDLSGLLVAAAPAAVGPLMPTLSNIFWVFAKAGAFVFGSGLAIVPFLYGELVQTHAWLNDRQFLDAVAVAMITPGPVVITVAFVGYLVGGTAGMSVAALGVFLPVYLFVIIPAPYFRRHRSQPLLKAFVEGVSAAATGAIGGAAYVLATRSLVDVWTIAIAAGTFAVLTRWKVSELWLIAAAALLGLLIQA